MRQGSRPDRPWVSGLLSRFFTEDQAARLQQQLQAYTQLLTQVTALAARAQKPLPVGMTRSRVRVGLQKSWAPAVQLVRRWATAARQATAAREQARRRISAASTTGGGSGASTGAAAGAGQVAPPQSGSGAGAAAGATSGSPPPQFLSHRPAVSFRNPHWPWKVRKWAGTLVPDKIRQLQHRDEAAVPTAGKPTVIAAEEMKLLGSAAPSVMRVVDSDKLESCVVALSAGTLHVCRRGPVVSAFSQQSLMCV